MKSVLISIHPKWCDLIASGKKTIEVRRTRPKIETPFKCYVYETKARSDMPTFVDEDGHVLYTGRGQVIGEFVCYCITPLYNVCTDEWRLLRGGLHEIEKQLVGMACLTEEELHEYANGKYCYAWHIYDLKIYDKPRELSEFYVRKHDERDYCQGCVHHECPVTKYPCYECVGDKDNRAYLYRPPQSWCYVEEV
jgi:predicted transcriptional regulator